MMREDPSSMQRALRALVHRRDELEAVLAIAQVGTARLDPDSQALTANTLFKADFGWPPDALITWESLEARVHPQDRGRLAAALDAVLRDGAELDLTVRASWRGVEPRWVALRGRLLSNERDHKELLLAARNATDEQRTAAFLASAVERERRGREAANRSHEARLAALSHDLRSPLNAILGWIRILGVKHGADPEIASIVERIERSARAQLKVIDDLVGAGDIRDAQANDSCPGRAGHGDERPHEGAARS